MKVDQVEKYLKVVGTAATILAMLSLGCLVAGSYFNSQIYTYFTEQTGATASASVTTVTITMISTSTSECTVHPCNLTRGLSETLVMSESISGYMSRALPAAEAKAAWQTKELLDDLGTIFLLISVTLAIVRWGMVRKRRKDSHTI